MRSADSSSPQVRVLAEHISDHLSVFVVAENTDAERPANGGLRLLSYDSDATCKADGQSRERDFLIVLFWVLFWVLFSLKSPPAQCNDQKRYLPPLYAAQNRHGSTYDGKTA
mgnify:CR=1 FL=1